MLRRRPVIPLIGLPVPSFLSRFLAYPLAFRDATSLVCVPGSSPAAFAHLDHDANIAVDGVHADDRFSQLSDSQAPILSSSARYASLASATASGFGRPVACHFVQPWIAQARMPGHSAFSFLPRSRSFSASVIVTAWDNVESSARCLVDAVQTRHMVSGDEDFELPGVDEEVLAHFSRLDLRLAGSSTRALLAGCIRWSVPDVPGVWIRHLYAHVRV
jgi:hypothetical protein